MGIGPQRRDELDASAPQAQVDRLDPLFLQPVADLHFGAEQGSIRLDGPIEVFDCEGDVVHGAHVRLRS